MDKNTENLIDKKIDNLALAIHKGFEDIYKKLEGVDDRFEGVEKTMATKEDLRELKREIEMKSQERHNELMNSNDKMIQIFEASQQELVASKFITDHQEEKLENHEKRIKFLEFQKAV